MNYRKIDKKKYLLNNIAPLVEEGAELTCWQLPKVGEEREVLRCRIVQIDILNEFIEFELLEDFTNFKPGKEVYFVDKANNIFFKAASLILTVASLKIFIPTEVNVSELRAHPRTRYELQDRHDMEIVFRDESGKTVRVKAPIIDISEGGVCLYLSNWTFERLRKAKLVVFPSLSPYVSGLSKAKGEQKHSRLVKHGTPKMEAHFAVGFQFSQIEQTAIQA